MSETVDVLVCGSGVAGLSGALVAALEGASVLVLEKADVVGGTTAMSGGGVWVPNNHHMGEQGVEDSREDALAYLRACVGESGEEEMLQALVDDGPDAVRYIEERGGVYFRAWPAVGGTSDYRPWLSGERPGARTLDPGWFELSDLGEAVTLLRNRRVRHDDKLDLYTKRLHSAPPGGGDGRSGVARGTDDAVEGPVVGGTALVARLFKACLDQGVRFRMSTAAQALVVQDGRVVGIDTGAGVVRALGGILLGTGGYSKNPDLVRAWMQRPLEFSCETAESEGDGHLMGMAIGAQTAHLGDAWFMPFIAAAGAPTYGGHSRGERALPHTLIVNGRGRRFVDEPLNYNDFGNAFGTKQDGPRNLPAWVVFDSQGTSKYGLLADFVEHSSGKAWVTSAATLGGLAVELRIDPAALSATVERFNEYARRGEDPDFDRGQNVWDVRWGDPANEPNPSLGTLETGPFHAVELRPGALGTKGGLRINRHGEVLSAATGAPIPGLYAAGNCASSATPGAYGGPGATLGAGLTFGYLAGLRLAAAAHQAERPPSTTRSVPVT
jgi:3-oxosteroid 1-dehydrogenase